MNSSMFGFILVGVFLGAAGNYFSRWAGFDFGLKQQPELEVNSMLDVMLIAAAAQLLLKDILRLGLRITPGDANTIRWLRASCSA